MQLPCLNDYVLSALIPRTRCTCTPDAAVSLDAALEQIRRADALLRCANRCPECAAAPLPCGNSNVPRLNTLMAAPPTLILRPLICWHLGPNRLHYGCQAVSPSS
jgi:hypothetical protein